MTIRNLTASAIAFAALATAFATPVAAATTASSDGTTWSTRISYTDLDLASAQGRAAFDKRVHGAAMQVCSKNYATMDERYGCARATYEASKPQMLAIIEASSTEQLALNDRH